MEDDDMIVLVVGDNAEIDDVGEHIQLLDDDVAEDKFLKQVYNSWYQCPEKSIVREDHLTKVGQTVVEHDSINDICDEKQFEVFIVKEEFDEYATSIALKDYAVQETTYKENIELNDSCDKASLKPQKSHYSNVLKTDKHLKTRNTTTKTRATNIKNNIICKTGKPFMRALSEHQSYVDELRNQCPELAQNEDLLISKLANIMREIKVPAPPVSYCIPNGNQLECVFCGKLSHTTWVAQRHFQENHGERYLICFACGSNFRSVTTLYKHEKRCLNADAVIVLKARAQMIGERGRNRPFLDDEKRQKEKQKAAAAQGKCSSRNVWMCHECPSEFASKASLEAHRLLHRGELPFRCEHCAAAYTTKPGLKRHMQVHSSEKYTCDICHKEFKVKVCLIGHLNTHLPEKKFMCIECGLRYSKKVDLEGHIITKHRNLPPPHVCQVCSKGFYRLSTLKAHMKQTHGLTIITRRSLLNKLPSLVEINKELMVDSCIVVKNVASGD